MQQADPITIRTELRPGDLGAIIHLHGTLYAREQGWDTSFEAYVAGPLSEFVLRAHPRERIWVAERDGLIVGCIAIVAASPEAAQLRWFLLEPRTRGTGVGRRLLHGAIAFARAVGYSSLVLWTERSLIAAAQLYRAAGFRLVEERPGHSWGRDVIEERYELELASTGPDRHGVGPREADRTSFGE
jgi:N-acetylglutamate synthase-like GNAT family acetyltransferase